MYLSVIPQRNIHKNLLALKMLLLISIIGKFMTLSLRLFYLVILQVIVTAFITYYLVTSEYRDLSKKNVDALESFLINQKKQELENYTDIAFSSIEHIYKQFEGQESAAKEAVAEVLNSMLYNGDDGYFFMYNEDGLGIVHPKEPYRVGKNWLDLEDNAGNKVILELIKNAQRGGDFYRYNWSQPSKDISEEKMSYSIYIERWDWMMGTGVYLNEVNQQLNDIQTEIDKHIHNTKTIILVVALTSIFFIFLSGIVVNLNHKKRAEKKINELGQRVIDVQEEENRHISRELHDGIIQILISIKYSIEATGLFLKKEKVTKPEPLSQAEENLGFAIQEVRRISHHMHPQILDELGLSSAIEALVKDFSKQTNIQVTVNKPSLRKLLPDYINTTLYRVVQESLTNIRKHAKAHNVIIDLSVQAKWLTLIVKDDGIGFDIDTQINSTNGIGLRNLAERVEYHMGHFDISSSKKGTITTIRLPTTSFANHFNKSNLNSENNNDKSD